MLYDITLRIGYTFGQNAASGRQILRVLPKDLPGRQRAVLSSIEFEPNPSEQTRQRDFFGNLVVEAVYRNAWHEIAFTVKARVRSALVMRALDLSPRLEHLTGEISAYRGLDPASPHHFCGPSPRISANKAITDYARAAAPAGGSVFDTVFAINQALYADIRFDAEATDVDTSAADAFAHRHGVCQDFAHIMITALRGIGVPAGYVSGYLRTIPPEGSERLEGADAMHAWVRAWCGQDAGWIEFDPTNGVLVGKDHVVVANGRDYSDVSPVTGVLKTTGAQETSQAVDVIPVEN